jgi:hypothetical protein
MVSAGRRFFCTADKHRPGRKLPDKRKGRLKGAARRFFSPGDTRGDC